MVKQLICNEQTGGSSPLPGSVVRKYLACKPSHTYTEWYNLYMIRHCVGCKIILTERHKIKFCSNKCQMFFQHGLWVKKWRNEEITGNIGINVRNFSGHIKRYLRNKYGDKCSECGWNKKHPLTEVVPLEIDHIDGDSENNKEGNLRLLCPNCHALTPFYKNLNKGKGRKWRMNKYIKNQIPGSP